MDALQVSRRAVLAGAAAFLARPAAAKEKLKLSIFSKHLQFVQGAELAKAAADLGFDGVDITVRKGGHIEPQRVKQELAAAGRYPAQTGARSPDGHHRHRSTRRRPSPRTSSARPRSWASGTTARAAGSTRADQPITAQLDAFRPRLEGLAKLNAKYQSCAMYHTHSGVGLVGAPIWDLHIMMKDIDPKLVGINYDVAHATIEGGLGGWIASYRVSGAHVRGIALKDFVWAKDARGRWREQWCPIGEGMVHFPEFLGMVAASGFNGPVQVHYEYPMPEENAAGGVCRDEAGPRRRLRGYLEKAGL